MVVLQTINNIFLNFCAHSRQRIKISFALLTIPGRIQIKPDTFEFANKFAISNSIRSLQPIILKAIWAMTCVSRRLATLGLDFFTSVVCQKIVSLALLTFIFRFVIFAVFNERLRFDFVALVVIQKVVWVALLAYWCCRVNQTICYSLRVWCTCIAEHINKIVIIANFASFRIIVKLLAMLD